MDKTLERTILIVKPPSYEQAKKIVYELEQNGMRVIGHLDDTLPVEAVLVLYKEHYGRDFFPWLCDQMISGPSIVFLVEGVDAVAKVRALAGETKPEEARIKSPNSLRAKYTDPDETFELSRLEMRAVKNVVHTPANPVSAKREGRIFFPTAFIE